MAAEKESRWGGRVTTVATGLAIIGALVTGGRYLLTPWFVTAATTAMADNIDSRIDAKTAPVKAGIQSMLVDKITELEGEVALLEARRDRDRSRWTDLDVMTLTQAQQRLANARRALSGFLAQDAESKKSVKGDSDGP